jgi:protein-S-isoprenylcysteine O-methyltransferase Ste14
MDALKTAIGIAWIPFWLYWLVAAAGAKEATGRGRRLPLTGVSVVAVVLLVHVLRGDTLSVHNPILGVIGTLAFASGIGLAVWGRVHLGHNWGLPRTEKAGPELVASGPYRFVRHPIYSGLLLGLLGTTLVTNLIGLVFVALLGAYFYYSAKVEEKNLAAAFPSAYPAYRAGTKMLVPFIL